MTKHLKVEDGAQRAQRKTALAELSLREILDGLIKPWPNDWDHSRLRHPVLFEGAKNHNGIVKMKKKSLASALGRDARTLYNWALLKTPPPGKEASKLVRLIVEHHRLAFDVQDFDAWSTTIGDEIKSRFRGARRDRAPAVNAARWDRDQLPLVELAQLERLPVSDDVELLALWYGRGALAVRTPAERLVTLATVNPVPLQLGSGMAHVAPKTRADCEALAEERVLLVPREVGVRFRVDPDSALQYRTLVYTDQPYPARVDMVTDDEFVSHTSLCRGGIAAFMDPRGTLYGPNASEPVRGWGCAAVIVAIAYDDGRPVSRSEAILVIRKGVLLPDDIFLAANGRPFESWPGHVGASRVLVQSRNEHGGSDVYAMDYDGGQAVRLTEGEANGVWECVVDDKGNDVAAWLQNGMVRIGRRTSKDDPMEAVERLDPFWSPKVNIPAPV